MMISLLLAAMVEIPVAPPVSAPVPTAVSRTVLASSGDELLAAWIDSRDRALHAARVSPEPRVLDREDIRFVPPNEPYASYESPAATATDRGYIVAFTRRFTDRYNQPEVLVARIGRDGGAIDREPRVVASGEGSSIAWNGTTVLVTWSGGRGRLFTPSLEPIADVALPQSEVEAIVPRPRGYLLALLRSETFPGKLSVVRIGDDGSAGVETEIGPAMASGPGAVAAAAAAEGALLLYGNGTELRDALVGDDGVVVVRRDLGRCDDRSLVTGLARHDRGYLATVICTSALHTVMPPPLPVYNLFTVSIGADGALHEIERAAERTSAWGLAALRGGLYTVVDNRTANVALVTSGRLFEPLTLSVGQPGTFIDNVVPANDGAIVFWRRSDIVRQEEAAMRATRLTSRGADASMVGRIISPTCYAVASTGRELLCLESSGSARVMTPEGQPLRSFPARGDAAVSDGAHWITYEIMKNPMRVVRTALDGSQAEETSFDHQSAWPMLQCADGACLLAWITSDGELWRVLLRGDRPLASARPQRLTAGAMWQEGAVGAAPHAFLVAASMSDGDVRAFILSAADGAVTGEITVARFAAGSTPFLAAGGGDDGFELLLFRIKMEAYRIGTGGDVHPLGVVAEGSSGRVVRSGGRGYVAYERDRHVFAVVTE